MYQPDVCPPFVCSLIGYFSIFTTSPFFEIDKASNVNFSPLVSRVRLRLRATLCALMPWLLDSVRTNRIALLKIPFTCECQLSLRTLDIATTVMI